MKNLSTILFLFCIGCGQNHISPDSVDNITLVQVDHPYIGHRVDSIKLDDKLVTDFLNDFEDRREEITKFYSCYVIKIHLKNGGLVSYRTTGHLFEKFKDDNTTATYFKLNKDVNLVTKYWGIQAESFCDRKQITLNDLKGNWYLNKWTMYHTLNFSDNTVFMDSHIDSVFTFIYSLSNDTLILRDRDSLIKYKDKIIAASKDTLIINSFDNYTDTLRYSRTKREWKN